MCGGGERLKDILHTVVSKKIKRTNEVTCDWENMAGGERLTAMVGAKISQITKRSIKSNVDIRMAVSNYRRNAGTLIHDAVRRRKARRHDSHVSLFVLSTMSWTDVDRPLSRRRRKAHPSWTHEWITKERRHMFRIWRYQNAFRNEGVIKLYCCRHGRLWKANRQS